MSQSQDKHSGRSRRFFEKGKRGILDIIFGRTFVILVALAAQMLVILGVFAFLQAFVPFVMLTSSIVAVIVVLYLINRSDEPTFKLTWIMLVLVAPIFGTLTYLWIHGDIGHRALHKRLDELLVSTGDLVKEDPDLMEELKRDDKDFYNLASYLNSCGSYPVYKNAYAEYYPVGEDNFKDILMELEGARDFIFMEYFIVENGYMWDQVLDILKRKAEEGVEVRVMYDGTSAIKRVPYNYPRKLEKMGIKCKMFAPLRIFMSPSYNNRDHRKILVIDGHTAYTGGINMADEYINQRELYGHWKDTAVKVKGEATRSFTLMFLQMWNVAEKEEDYEKYLHCDVSAAPSSTGYVIPYGDSPLDSERIGETVYCDILNHAANYVHIMTPYLILDSAMTTALISASKHGVQVQLILPHIPDKRYAFALAKTHYKQLISAGVEIYEYLPGFIHAKVFTSDDTKAVVGTINLDYRSLYHHFECGLYMYETPVVADIEKDFQETLARCQKMTMEDVRKDKIRRKLVGRVLKLVAPLM